jgi:hypothetical protein
MHGTGKPRRAAAREIAAKLAEIVAATVIAVTPPEGTNPFKYEHLR